ncbi:MAG: GatB/YqeY domain-containing protein, partial [Steroidobacteraceae bacterium]
MSEAEEKLRARLTQDVQVAMKARDAPRVTALRSLAAALDNATAVPLESLRQSAGRAIGEVPRKDLSSDDVRAIVRREITERRDAAFAFESHG